jgi:hypothetical protein
LLNFINWILNLPVRPIKASNLGDLLTLVALLGWLYLVCMTLLLTIALIVFLIRSTPRCSSIMLRWFGKPKATRLLFLELTFPANVNKSAYATEQLHILLRSRSRSQSLLDRLAGYKERYSLELASTNDQGIRYILVVPAHDGERIRQSLLSFLPGMRIKEITDYVVFGPDNGHAEVVELRLSTNFVFPLKEHKILSDYDFVAFMTGHMTKLDAGDVIAVQIVATPLYGSTHPWVMSHIHRVEGLIASGKEVSGELHRRVPRTIQICLMLPLWVIVFLLRFMLAMITAFIHHPKPGSYGTPETRGAFNPYEQELAETIKFKLDQHLFEVSIRILVMSRNTSRINQRLGSIQATFNMFSSSWQAIVRTRELPIMRARQAQRKLERFQSRALTPTFLSYGSIVSSSELSDLYHFPNTDITKTEGLVKSRSKELAAPLSVRQSGTNFDIIVGTNNHGGSEQPIGLPINQRRKHLYMIGKTGTGKTTLLTSMIYQDMVNGKGLAVLDPHGDMFHELQTVIPQHRRGDVVVFDPSDREYPIGLNILDPGIEFANEDDKQEWITSAVLSVFAKLADKNQWGPRMEHILRNATLTTLQTPKPNLYTLQRILTDKRYQREIVRTLKDPILKQFWDKEFKLLGTMQLSNVVAPLTHRLGHFITTKMCRHILLQEKTTVRIADIMNEGKILLVNLSKGDIGEDQSAFFGTILTSLIWMAAYQRTKIQEQQRKDFFVYVDEFQNFATPQFSSITSEGRKFRVSLIVSHQNIAQIEDKNVVRIIAGNAATMVCLKASPEDEAFILPYMKPEVEKGDIVNLTPYHFYMKITSDESEDAFSGMTVPLNIPGAPEVAHQAVVHSRDRYGTPRVKVEAYLDELFDGNEKKPTKMSSKKKVNTSKGIRGNYTKEHGA